MFPSALFKVKNTSDKEDFLQYPTSIGHVVSHNRTTDSRMAAENYQKDYMSAMYKKKQPATEATEEGYSYHTNQPNQGVATLSYNGYQVSRPNKASGDGYKEGYASCPPPTQEENPWLGVM